MSRLASYDYAGLARLLRPELEKDGRGWRACAAEIGVTAPDLSRVCAGQAVSAPKVLAICDWLNVSYRTFYRPGGSPAPHPEPVEGRGAGKCFTGKALKQEERR